MKKVLFLMVSVLILGLVFTGCSEITKISSPATGNTDDVIYKCECFGPETATGVGDKIKSKGTWFMYNEYFEGGWQEGDNYVYQIQAGNPKNNNENIIGIYWILNMGNGWYRAKYDIDSNFVVIDEHLAIDDDITKMDFTGAPGKDDNQDFGNGNEFYDEDGEFYIFAHFAVECAK